MRQKTRETDIAKMGHRETITRQDNWKMRQERLETRPETRETRETIETIETIGN